MGCDIHLYHEFKNSATGEWETLDKWEGDPYEEENDGKPREIVAHDNRIYTDRNYSLFAMLADVRNGVGFAGVDLGDGFVPIHAVRGIAADSCKKYRDEAESWNGDGHSHSHATLQELLAYDWHKTTKERGVVDGPEYKKWVGYGKVYGYGPSQYSGSVSGGSVSNITTDEMDGKIAEIGERMKRTNPEHEAWQLNEVTTKRIQEELHSTYCQIEWESPYWRCVSEFLANTMTLLVKKAHEHAVPYTDIRITYFFDN